MVESLLIPASKPLDDPLAGSVVLLVEDEAPLARAVSYVLRADGFLVRWARDGAQALQQFRRGGIEIILLDLMLPQVDGYSVCRAVRMESNVPVLMVTARTSEDDILRGFEAGADDYLTKPFGLPELVARVRALLRRDVQQPAGEAEVLTAGPFSMRLVDRTVWRDGARIAFRPKEFDLLLFLARRRGQVVHRAELLERVWGYPAEAETRTLDVHVRLVREKLEQDPAHPRLLETVRGVGYRLA